MRVDLGAFGQAVERVVGAHPAVAVKAAAAAAGVLLAAATVVLVAWPGADEAPVDAVISAEPVFTPVTWKPAVAAPAMAAAPSSPYDDGASGRATDMRDPASVTRAVQRHLKRAGCYGGPINGRWTARTRQGMAAFTESVNARLPVDGPDAVLLALLETHADVTCAEGAVKRRPEETASIAPRAEPAPAMHEPSSVERIAAVDETAPETASSGFEDEAAALAAAPAVRKAVKADRPRANKRKYRRGPSVSRSFRKLQRSVSRLFF